MTMNAALDDLRSEIDRLDDQLHDLLIRRTEIVAQIGAHKKKSGAPALALRPGREAAILRRLLDRHQGPFPKAALLRIWRELLSAQVALQGPFSIAAFAPEGSLDYRDLARDQYGTITPVTLHPSVNQVLNAVVEGDAKLGILPMPWGERPNPWWRGLATEGADAPRIIARLPFIRMDSENREQPDALVIARAEPEKSGDDSTLFAVEISGGLSRDRMRDLLAAVGLDVTWVGVWQDPEESSHALHLLSANDFLSRGEPRLAAFIEQGGPEVVLASTLGSYAEPVILAGCAPASVSG